MKRSIITIYLGACLLLPVLAQGTEPSPKNTDHREGDYFVLKNRVVKMDLFESEGRVLDIGGGGEGIIGLLKPDEVIAIDINKRELDEAPPGPLKIVMDARDLKFVDRSFATATSFFTLMYIDPADHQKVFSEVFRVLRPGGRFLVWDSVIPTQIDKATRAVLVRLTIEIPGKTINTGYGVRWPKKTLDLNHYTSIAKKAGFKVLSRKQDGRLIAMELQKPATGRVE